MDETINVWKPDGSRFDSITVPLSEWPLARFSPVDNRVLIVSGEPYKTVRIWQPGDAPIVLGGNDPEEVREACFAPDGKSILTASSKIPGMIRRWTPEGKYRGYLKADSLGSGIQASSDVATWRPWGDHTTLNLFDLTTQQMTPLRFFGEPRHHLVLFTPGRQALPPATGRADSWCGTFRGPCCWMAATMIRPSAHAASHRTATTCSALLQMTAYGSGACRATWSGNANNAGPSCRRPNFHRTASVC